MKTTRFSCLALLLSLAACGDGPGDGDAGTRVDAPAAVDAGAGEDAPSIVDAPSSDDAPASLDARELVDTARGGDAYVARDDAGPPTDTGCTYLDEPLIVFCVEAYDYVRSWTAVEGAEACPPYATGTDGERYDTVAEAIAGSVCEDSCVWRAAMSVSLLRCGRRTGYIEFRAEGCDPVIETPDGIFRSREEWDAAAPCP